MNGAPPAGDRPQTLGEEIANGVSHGVGVLAALVGAPVLILAAADRGPVSVVGASVFAATVVLLYLTSMLYHAMPRNRSKPVFRVLDHCAIFLLIAGTYTPFTLGVLRGPWGWSLLAAVWVLAVAGIVLKTVAGTRHPRLSTTLYLGMGWLAVVAVEPLWRLVPAWGLAWLVAGGLFYTAGVAFFATDDRVRYHHFVWHLFVMAGTACHFVAVLRYAG